LRKEKKVTIMMEAERWEKFRKICDAKDISASQVLREFVRDTVENKADRVGVKIPGGEKL
jgi:hypothetical protein